MRAACLGVRLLHACGVRSFGLQPQIELARTKAFETSDVTEAVGAPSPEADASKPSGDAPSRTRRISIAPAAAKRISYASVEQAYEKLVEKDVGAESGGADHDGTSLGEFMGKLKPSEWAVLMQGTTRVSLTPFASLRERLTCPSLVTQAPID